MDFVLKNPMNAVAYETYANCVETSNLYHTVCHPGKLEQ